MKANSFRHGHSATSVNGARRITAEYKAWSEMRQRCYNANNSSYEDYGGRGIKVCTRWLECFENFFADMGLKPSPQHSIDRINNYGNYEPANCRWATRSQQARNQRPRRPVYQKVRSDSSAGIKNVIIDREKGKYRAYVRISNKRIHLGYFITIDDACRAIEEASK